MSLVYLSINLCNKNVGTNKPETRLIQVLTLSYRHINVQCGERIRMLDYITKIWQTLDCIYELKNPIFCNENAKTCNTLTNGPMGKANESNEHHLSYYTLDFTTCMHGDLDLCICANLIQFSPKTSRLYGSCKIERRFILNLLNAIPAE